MTDHNLEAPRRAALGGKRTNSPAQVLLASLIGTTI